MQYSYSRADCFKKCPFQYKLRYVDCLETIDEYDSRSPLTLGTAVHTGIEDDVASAIQSYYSQYPVITDSHIEEAMKLENLIPKVKDILPPNGRFEVEILTPIFKGYIDYLYPLNDGTFGIIDFKYSNNVDNYLKSNQLHIYKYFAEKVLRIKVSEIQFLFIPKIQIRQKKTENQSQFRKRLSVELSNALPKLEPIEYDASKVADFLRDIKSILNTSDFTKNESKLCDWCEYKKYCLKGDDIDMLPSTNRVAIAQSNYKKLWLYGLPFSGKTTVADQAPTPLNLNTDGNVKYVTMARVPIKDEVKKEGRITKRVFAWEKFVDAVDELEAGSDFETIVVDLLEDTYDYCRVFMCDKNNWEHESDDSFKAYDIVRSEFLRTIKRLLNLPYNIILISHEDTSRDIMKKGNDKVTSITPNIAEKLRLKIAGMVDLVARVVVEDDGSRTLNFKSNEVIFGGGRLKGITTTKCELTWEAIEGVYKEVEKQNKPKTAHEKKVEEFKKSNDEAEVDKELEQVTFFEQEQKQEETTPSAVQSEPVAEVEAPKEAPVRRTRRVRN